MKKKKCIKKFLWELAYRKCSLYKKYSQWYKSKFVCICGQVIFVFEETQDQQNIINSISFFCVSSYHMFCNFSNYIKNLVYTVKTFWNFEVNNTDYWRTFYK